MKLWIAVIACCASALAFPAGALAGHCAPPGVSGVDQYFETVPGPGCNQGSTGGGGNGHGHGGGGQLAPGTGRQLAAQGATGAAVQRLVATTGPAVAIASQGSNGSSTKSGGTGSGAHKGTTQSASGVSVHVPPVAGRGLLSALLHPIVSGSASGGAGILLPAFLAAALAFGIGAIVVRRRRIGSH